MILKQIPSYPQPTEISGKLAVIGDAHGHVRPLKRLLNRILAGKWDMEGRWIVFTGDFIDRGPASRQVVDLVLELRARRWLVAACMGNHELMCCRAIGITPCPQPPAEKIPWFWRKRPAQFRLPPLTPAQMYIRGYFSESTFMSYGATPGDIDSLERAMPDSHKEFLSSLPWVVEHPDYLIVHAGLRPEPDLQTQLQILRDRDFSIFKPPWLCDHGLSQSQGPEDCDKTIISGHVRQPRVVKHGKRILLDTSGGVEGGLSAVLLPEEEVLRAEL